MAAITVADLTEGTLNGTGVFDKLMQANKAHLEEQYSKSRIKGPEYATVYLGSLQAVMEQALQFILQEQQVDLQAQMLQEQLTTENLKQDNLVAENAVLVAQKCKLEAEFDLIMEQKLKVIAETALLMQKKVTEQAQTSGAGIGEDSVIGKQISLYDAQKDGYRRDAEQKVAKLFVDTWNVRKTMDDSTPVNDINKLGDTYIGSAIERLLTGVGVVQQP